MMSGSHLSKDFFDLVKAIGESKSKQQEDNIIVDEVATLKKRMPEANVSKKKMKEFLIRLVYVEMLGHDASFGYIKAIELAASKNLVQKRVGYLCSGLCLSPSHEFRFMLVNQLQQDMSSANYLEVGAALTACLRLATADMIPALTGHVVKLTSHGRELVRKKVVMVLHRFHQLDPSAVAHLGDAMRRTLCDKDPSVMTASLCLLHDMIALAPGAFKELVPSFVSILKQIVEHRLPRDFDYHRIPAPWAQLRLLRVLAHLGRADQGASEGMYEILSDVMRRADTGINVGYAIVYECVRTITTVYPNSTLLDEAAKSISRFLQSENHNLKYLGITGLAQVVEGHPKYAAEHQLAVIDCLEDVDDTLKRKTLDLLYRMMNPVNVEFIASKLLASLESSADEFLRSALVSRLCTAAERFAPSNDWYVSTVIKVMELAGDLVQPEVAQNLVALIAEGGEDGDEDGDSELRASAVDRFAAMLDWEAIPDSLLHILAWVLGEYGPLCTTAPLADLALAVADLASDDARLRGSLKARSLLVTALLKMVGQMEGGEAATVEPVARKLAERFMASSQLELQQRALECLNVLDAAAGEPDLLSDVLPYDASLEDPLDGVVTENDDGTRNADDALGFLDRFVASALNAGAAPYAPPGQDDDDDDDDAPRGGADASGLKFEAYAKPTKPSYGGSGPGDAANYSGNPNTANDAAIAAAMQAQEGGYPPNAPGLGGLAAPKPSGNAIGSGLGGGGLAAASGPWGSKPALPQPSMDAGYPSDRTGHGHGAGPQAYGGARSNDSRDDYGAGGGADQQEKSAEQEEKERMAAALFGGVVASSAAPKPKPNGDAKAKPPSRFARQPAQRNFDRNPDPAPAPPPAPPAAPEPNLLDMMDDPQPPPPPQRPPRPEPDLLGDFGASGASPAAAQQPPPQQPPQAAADPFAAFSGLSLGPGAAPPAASAFAPAQGLSTADFGGKWGTSKHERKSECSAPPTMDLNALSDKLRRINAAKVEAIPATSELILASTHAPSSALVLFHVKLLPTRNVLVTVRSTDPTVSQTALDAALTIIPGP